MKKGNKNRFVLGVLSVTVLFILLSSQVPNTFAYTTVSVSQSTYVPKIEKPLLKSMESFSRSLTTTAQSSNDKYMASSGFSSQQGFSQWYYQQWNGSSYSNMTWDSAYGRWKGTPAYTLVMSNAQHPDTQDSVRKWMSPRNGTIQITGTVKKGDTSTGDGVLVKVMKNQQQLWPVSGWQKINYNDSIGYNLDVKTSVNTGDGIYFIVNKNGTTYADTTTWDPVITYENLSASYTYEYNEAGRVVKVITPSGKVTVFKYDKNGNLTKKMLQP